MSFKTLIYLLNPFSTMQKLSMLNYMFYPQKVLAAIIVSMFTIVYAIIVQFKYSFENIFKDFENSFSLMQVNK